MTHVAFTIPEIVPVPRHVWQYGRADWNGLSEALQAEDWKQLLGEDPHLAAEIFTDTVLATAKRFIPNRVIITEKSSHPWINNQCRRAIAEKCAAEGSPF